MDLKDAVCIVTGAGGGIGAALAQGLASRGAAHVVVADLDGDAASRVASEVGGSAVACDVGRDGTVEGLVTDTQNRHGRIDLICSNAGILRSDAPGDHVASAPDQDWMDCWSVNVMAHVRLARAALPAMLERGSGAFLLTVSAAGLLNIINNATYAATKHAALGFAESLAITHGDDGIAVAALCPQAVDTAMVRGARQPSGAGLDGIMSPEDVAAAGLDGLEQGQFLILPHPQVRDYFRNKAENYDRWVGGMRKFRRTLVS